jgi:hypothetical protein
MDSISVLLLDWFSNDFNTTTPMPGSLPSLLLSVSPLLSNDDLWPEPDIPWSGLKFSYQGGQLGNQLDASLVATLLAVPVKNKSKS